MAEKCIVETRQSWLKMMALISSHISIYFMLLQKENKKDISSMTHMPQLTKFCNINYSFKSEILNIIGNFFFNKKWLLRWWTFSIFYLKLLPSCTLLCKLNIFQYTKVDLMQWIVEPKSLTVIPLSIINRKAKSVAIRCSKSYNDSWPGNLFN